ncbi:hypothetical protein DOTSEDRAFT_75779 [Dothistroma septosporum NZE10]|uniref:Peptidase A1 domain-containing protein n=1 Tax=Dothistroma septosporum (strain NZE10 / CBS 128990) TaxID=675120 RepID=N1PBQ0_DOTSN|nr:hypothetical protein DOTSEDRAFT_75779 [Dothistroma septosporum NZE10]
MLAFLLICLLPKASATTTSTASCSDPTPIALPITNVKLSNSNVVRGIPLSIGTPPQNFSFMPHDFFNNTWVYNISEPFCFENTTKAQCLSQRGGFYDPASSTSAKGGLDVSEASGSPSDTEGIIDGPHIWFSRWTTDKLQLGNITLEDFPIGMAGLDFGGRLDTQANIGLGQNSTFLQALKDDGKISSRTWSYWPGIDSATASAARDGQIVFGGYDAAKATGPNVTQRLGTPTQSCPSGMSVIVTGMQLDFPNGTQADILAPSTFSACLQVDFPFVMTTPFNPYYERFMNMTLTAPFNNSLGIHWFDPVFDPHEVYAGGLTVSLSNGFGVTILNDVLVVPDQYVGPSGALETNQSQSALLIGSLNQVNANDVPIIGKEFFSSAYLMIDYDAGTYTLWQVNATTETQLVAVGGQCSTHPTVNNNTIDGNPESASSTSTATPANSVSSKAGAREALPTGAIVGAVVGSAFGTGALVAAIILIFLRKRRSSAGSTTDTALLDHCGSKSDLGSRGPPSYHLGQGYGLGLRGPSEMAAGQMQLHELGDIQKAREVYEVHGSRTPKYELAAYGTPR